MQYVNRADVLEKFIRYLKEYDSELISKQTAIDELQDALDDADYEEIDTDYFSRR